MCKFFTAKDLVSTKYREGGHERKEEENGLTGKDTGRFKEGWKEDKAQQQLLKITPQTKIPY